MYHNEILRGMAGVIKLFNSLVVDEKERSNMSFTNEYITFAGKFIQ